MKNDMKIIIGLTALVTGSYFALSLIYKRKKIHNHDACYSSITY
jgi:hypothetical protein